MRPATLLLVLVPAVMTAAAPPPRVRVDLLRYYANQEPPPAWQAAVKRLGDRDKASRVQAADYLLKLLTQAREDERTRLEPWEAEPYQREIAPGPARQLRSQVADKLAGTHLSAEGERVLHWFLEEEPDPELQEAILPALGKLSGRSARTWSLALFSRPHPNAAVVIAALDVLRRGKTPVPAEALDSLCNHPRASIREAARRLHKELGRPDHKPFDPAATMRTRRVRDLLQHLRALMSEPPPMDRKLVRARFLLPGDSEDDEDDPLEFRGWFLRETKEEAEVLNVAGKRWTEKKPVPVPGVRPEDQSRWIIRAVKIEEEVLRLEKAHKDRLASLQEFRPEARFDGELVDWHSLVFAWWLDARGRPADAARVLLPILDGVHRDEDLLRVARSHRGYFFGLDMLNAFVGDRDYPHAERLARVVDTRFVGTRFHAHARRLLAELPLRRDDFRTLKLPAAAEWASLRATLPRAVQLDYLCSRLRLLNCTLVSRWIELTGPQYAEASKCALFGWHILPFSTPKEVINPLKELTDPASATRVRLADVPQLARYLADDWTVLALTDGIHTKPGYVRLSTRPLLADVINGLARRDICRLDRWTNLTAREREREIARIAAWARANEGKTEVQLEWEILREEVQAGADWYTVQPRLSWLLARKQYDGLTVLRAYLLDARTPPAARAEILKLYDRYDPAVAPGWR